MQDSAVAHNYHPLPVTIVEGEGAWVTDDRGRRHLDFLAAYSALNFGHRHPRLIAAAHRQLDRVTLTSRAFGSEELEPFCAELADLCGYEAVLPMVSGAEAVETAIKAARRWGYECKGVPDGEAKILVCADDFHGRTTTIVGFSTDPDARHHFGPFTPGFEVVPFGDAAAMADAIDDRTVAVLLEPVQGEAGVQVPPPGWLQDVRRTCTERDVLLIADEVQSGLGRTGATLACDHERVRPDMVLLGKALGGGIVASSAVVADRAVLDVFTPGSHGSTFGGNPMAAAVGREVIAILRTGELQARAATLGAHLLERLRGMDGVTAVRGKGLWAGIDVEPARGTARQVCERLLALGVLAKDTHGHTIRVAPPLTIDEADLDWGLDQVEAALRP